MIEKKIINIFKLSNRTFKYNMHLYLSWPDLNYLDICVDFLFRTCKLDADYCTDLKKKFKNMLFILGFFY